MKCAIKTDEKFSPSYIDPSSFTSFSRCPAHYMFSRLMGLRKRGTSSIAMDYGTCIHLALPHCYSMETLDMGVEIFKSAWKDFGYGEDDNNRNSHCGERLLRSFASHRVGPMCPYERVSFPKIDAPTNVEKVNDYEIPFLIDIGASLPMAGRIDLAVKWKQDRNIWPNDYKGQPLDAVVMSAFGPVQMRDVKPGMPLIDSEGQIQEVLGVFPLGQRDIYRVTFSDGTETECTKDHLWTVKQDWPPFKTKTIDITTMLEGGLYRSKNKPKYIIPKLSRPAEFVYRKDAVPLDPYLIGVLLGDGCCTGGTIRFNSSDLEIWSRIQERNSEMEITESVGDAKHSCPTYRILGIHETIESLGMAVGSKEKRVPIGYLMNGLEVRKPLLQGLMDTDGSVSSHGTPTFHTTSRGLASDVQFLVESLGGICSINTYHAKLNNKDYGEYYFCILQLPKDIEPFSLKRKSEKLKTKRERDRRITDIKLVGREECQCIKVSNPNGLYFTNNFICTHNTASEISSRLFECFWNSPQAISYTIAMSHLTGEAPQGMMIEAIRVSHVNNEVCLFPIYIPDVLIQRFVEEFKQIADLLLSYNENQEWPCRSAACSAYGMFGIPSGICPFKELCSAEDWHSIVSLYEQTKPYHPFEIK